MRYVALVFCLILVGCSEPEWTASETAAVQLSCLQASAVRAGAPVDEILQSEDLVRLCGNLAAEIEAAGCSPEEGTDVALGLSMGTETYEAMLGEC